jgi:hypothetical protein
MPLTCLVNTMRIFLDRDRATWGLVHNPVALVADLTVLLRGGCTFTTAIQLQYRRVYRLYQLTRVPQISSRMEVIQLHQSTPLEPEVIRSLILVHNYEREREEHPLEPHGPPRGGQMRRRRLGGDLGLANPETATESPEPTSV